MVSVEAENSAEDLALARQDLMEEMGSEGRVDLGSVFDDGTDEGIVGVEEGLGVASLETSLDATKKIGAVADFLESGAEVLGEGAGVLEGDTEVFGLIGEGDRLVVYGQIYSGGIESGVSDGVWMSEEDGLRLN